MKQKIAVLIDGGHLRSYARRAKKNFVPDYIEKVGHACALADEVIHRILCCEATSRRTPARKTTSTYLHQDRQAEIVTTALPMRVRPRFRFPESGVGRCTLGDLWKFIRASLDPEGFKRRQECRRGTLKRAPHRLSREFTRIDSIQAA